jgi:hypothetical protein
VRGSRPTRKWQCGHRTNMRLFKHGGARRLRIAARIVNACRMAWTRVLA